ncbi:MAG: MBL fold metallo-hydrolase [Chlorobiaceae bacterium]
MLAIGDYSLASLDAQDFALDGGAMFGVVPKTMWGSVAPADALNRVRLSARLLLISGDSRHILVDTGMGTAWPEKLRTIYDVSPFRLHDELQRHGVHPEEITDVILTHLHFDHAGGAYRLDGDRLEPLFPDACFYLQEENWRQASAPNPKEKVSYNRAFVEALGRQKHLRLLDGETRLFKGITLLPTNGHTRGQQMVKISDGLQTLLYCGDLIPSSAHIPLPWVTGYDIEPLRVIEEKSTLLRQAALERWILFFGHDPVHAAATVRLDEKGVVLERFIDL